jgi:hypothetical protein
MIPMYTRYTDHETKYEHRSVLSYKASKRLALGLSCNIVVGKFWSFFQPKNNCLEGSQESDHAPLWGKGSNLFNPKCNQKVLVVFH